MLSCSGEEKKSKKVKTPEDVISHDRMVDILVDYHLTESTIKYYMRYGVNVKQLTEKIYDRVLEKHNITRSDFKYSMDFYSEKPERMEMLYMDVMEKLSSIQSEQRRRK